MANDSWENVQGLPVRRRKTKFENLGLFEQLEAAGHLDRAYLQERARKLRASALRAGICNCRSVELNDLSEQELLLLENLRIREPLTALAQSRLISDRAIADLPHDGNPLELAGIVGAILERELWELPTDNSFSANLTLSKHLGCYFTPPNVAWYITCRTMGPTFQSAYATDDVKSLEAFFRSRIVDPACGAGIFLACAWKFLMESYDLATVRHPGLARRLGDRKEFGKSLARFQLFGIDISNRAAEGTRKLIALIADLQQDEITRIVKADALDDLVQFREPIGAQRANSNPLVEWGVTNECGAFDFVLLNPPYGRLRALTSDFQEESRAMTLRGKRLQRVLEERKQHLSHAVTTFRSNPEFKPATQGILDWQRLFIVRARSIALSRGRIGMIVPASLLADRSSAMLRAQLLDTCTIERIDRLRETAKLFNGVNQPTCIVVLQKGGRTVDFVATSPLRELPPARAQELKIHADILWTISNDRPIPPVSDRGIAVLRKLGKHPRLREHHHLINARGEFDLTTHRRYMTNRGTRLIRGDHLERFQVRRSGELDKKEFVDKKRFLMEISTSEKTLHSHSPRLVGRQVSYMEKARRLSFAIVPPGCVVSNSCNYVLPDNGDSSLWLDFLCGLMNSTLFEWRFRMASSNNHVNNYELAELPIPVTPVRQIAKLSKRLSELAAGSPFGALARPSLPLESRLDREVFELFNLSTSEAETVLSETAAIRELKGSV